MVMLALGPTAANAANAASAATVVKPPPYGPVTLHYYGSVGTQKVQMEITVDDGKVTGAYWYEMVGRDIELEGTYKYEDLTISIGEKDNAGKTVARFRGKLNPLAGAWTGTWTTVDGKMRREVQFKLAAEVVTTTEKRMGHIDVTVIRPLLAEARLAGNSDPLQQWVDGAAFWPSEQMASLSLGSSYFEPGSFTFSYESFTRYRIRYYSPTFISMLGTVYAYTGGAHGMTETVPLNMVRRGDDVHFVELEELMKTGSGWEKKLSNYVIADLKKQDADWVVNGEVTSVAVDKLYRFTLTPAGIEFHFDAYEMGPYAKGTFSVNVPWSELKGMVNLNGPAGLIAGGARAK